jgi:predicted lipoprotein with Yx(FWY)xxD motif
VIRRNRIAIAVAGGMATVLALVMWSTNAVGVQGTNVAQTGSAVEAAAAPGDYGYDTPAAAGTDAPAAGAQTSAADQPPAAAAPPVSNIRLVAKTVDKMGDVVQDGDGRTLYRFDKDTPKPPVSNCNDKCAETWPPLLNNTPGATPQLEGVDPALVGTLKRADGSEQITIDGWGLYTYSKDPAPGKWAGQGVGGTWFVIQPNGKRNVECLPPGVTAPAA